MKKIILYILIATFCISAILGISIIVLDLWNDLTEKVLLTTITIFGFSIPTLCCSSLYEKKTHNTFALIGIVVCLLSGLYVVSIVWEIFVNVDEVFRLFLSGITLSASFAHLSLMLLINNKDEAVIGSRNATIVVSVIMDVMILFAVWIEENFFTWQLYAIVAILIALGTIVTPILNKVRVDEEKKENLEKTMVEEQGEKVKNKIAEIETLSKMVKKGYILEEEFNKISERIIKKNS